MRARLGLCLLLAVAATGAAHSAELSLAQAEKGLRVAEGLPSRENWQGSSLRYRVEPLEAAFRSATAHDPGRAYQGLARCQMLLGRYRQAARWFRRAVKAAPGNRGRGRLAPSPAVRHHRQGRGPAASRGHRRASGRAAGR